MKRLRRQSADATRHGFTLLEVLLSAMILAVSLAALSQQSDNGVKAALRTQLECDAALRCRSVLDSFLSGSIRTGDHTRVAFENDSLWRWSTTVEPSEFESLDRLTVVVEHRRRPEVTFTLQRLIRTSRPDQPPIRRLSWQ